ncbi:DUF2474 domain-containing protein [Swingsia samuiensis]|uniref:DUF2474 domain-containing protein n=1 Tax=Swingsia samuiensis TaxID=1293412 RepID=A0A4Y6UFS6_9PROT|nr:DUF2474 domain-containing protein [Swingsia samuiensis]QDH16399.1 DUF2474 domain-containing protein [Swingsia samuiensis]
MRIEYGKLSQKTGPLSWMNRLGWFVLLWLGGVSVVGIGAELLKVIIFGKHT